MANRFPLIIDTDDGNKLKELPIGDNLNLAGSGIVNAGSIAATGLTIAGVAYGGFAGVFDTHGYGRLPFFGISDALCIGAFLPHPAKPQYAEPARVLSS